MRGVGIYTVLGIIGTIYAIGLVIYYWPVLAGIVVFLFLVNHFDSGRRPVRTARPQAHYSNRR